MFLMLVIWLCVSCPLVLLGTIMGRATAVTGDFPCRINALKRPIPEGKWYTRPLALAAFSGILPFGSIMGRSDEPGKQRDETRGHTSASALEAENQRAHNARLAKEIRKQSEENEQLRKQLKAMEDALKNVGERSGTSSHTDAVHTWCGICMRS
jgi:hypothetical protein